MHTADKIPAEHIQNISLSFMAEIFLTLMLNNLNSVAAPPLVSASVEVPGVFITIYSSPDFASLFLDHKLSLTNSAQKLNNDRPKIGLSRTKSAALFHKI